MASPPRDESELPTTYVNNDEHGEEIFLSPVTTIVDIHTRVSDLYSSPHDQIAEQIRLTVETVKERQEAELINNADYGLIASAEPGQRISRWPRSGESAPGAAFRRLPSASTDRSS